MRGIENYGSGRGVPRPYEYAKLLVGTMRGSSALVFIMIALLAACETTPTATTADPFAGVPQVKLLATVAATPTADASLLATPAVASAPTLSPTALPTATPYVGVFLGDGAGENLPIFDAERFTTPTAVVATLEPLTVCEFTPDERYGSGWTTSQVAVATLGCPGETAASYEGALQLFERGVMVYIPSGEIWAISQGVPSGRYWYVTNAPPEQPIGETPPEGLRLPVSGFGATWIGIPGVRQALGFGRTEEAGTPILVQRFLGGLLIQDMSTEQTFALLGVSAATGVVYGPF
jgi:hypothetical protein